MNIIVKKSIDKSLKLIGQKCTKVLNLDLGIDEEVPITDRFFDVFTHFKAIKKLRIDLPNETVLSGSVECFKHCKQLYNIDIIDSKPREDFFANIALFVPKLQSLEIWTKNQFSDSFIDSFNSMKNIQRVKLRVNNDRNERIETKFWYFGKKLFEVMSSAKGKDVKRVNDNCGLIACYQGSPMNRPLGGV